MLTQLLDWILAFFLVVWFLLSVAFQFRGISGKLSRIDPIAMLPRWTFFAPNPGIHDHHLLFRCCDENVPTDSSEDWIAGKQCFSDWKELNILGAESACIPLLWNPSRRVNKVVCDLANSLLTARKAYSDFNRVAPVSLEYIVLTNLVVGRVAPGQKYQWALVRSSGWEDNRTAAVVFMSLFHRNAMAVDDSSSPLDDV